MDGQTDGCSGGGKGGEGGHASHAALYRGRHLEGNSEIRLLAN